MENPINVDETISQTTKEPFKNENKAARSSSGDRSDDGSGSPPPNCSICLGKLINTSFTDSCFHQFCFTCLLQWSKIKTECPLCKQTFKSIIHNVRGERDYDQYHVPRDVPQAISQQFPPIATVDVNLEIIRGPHYDYGGYPHRRLAYRTTMTTPNHQRRYRMLLNPSVSRPETVANIAQQVSSEERRRRSEHPITYRRNVYRNGQWSAELASAFQRPLEHSAEYFRRNPCELERLIPWINRDLQILLNANDPRIAYVLHVILDALKEYDLRSAELRDRLREFFSIHTDHFIHELMNFAQTGVDLAAYDNFITYPPPNSLTNSYVNTLQSPVLSDNSSTASDDSDVRVVDEIDSMSINNTNNNNNNNNNFNINMNNYPLLATHTIDMPGPSTVSQTFQMPIVNSVRSLRHLPTPDILTISSSSSSDENDCEFVGYIKPRHERTPEIIELMSSDGDDNGDNDHDTGGAAGGTAGASGGASISVGNFNEDNDDLNNIEIINTNDNNSFTPISTSLNLLEPKPGTSHDFNYDDDDDDSGNNSRRTRRTRRKKTLIQNISYDLSTNESSSESESDSDSDYGEKKKKTCRKSKKKLTKINKNNLKKKSTTSTSKNMKKKKVKTRFKKIDSATSSNDNDDKIGGENNTKTIASVVVVKANDNCNNNSNNNNNNNNNNHTEDSDSSTSFSESSSWSLSSSKSSSKNTYNNDKNNKKRKKKLSSKTNKRGKYITKTKKNNDKTKNKKNNNCPPVSTVLRKKTDKNNEWYVDKQRFNCIYSSNTSDDDDDKGEDDGTSFINKSSSIKKEENYKWNDNFNDGIGSNDELESSRNKTNDHTELTNKTSSQMDICSDTNNSNKYKSKYHDKYKKIYHDIDQPCTSSQSLTSCTSSLSSFKYSDDKKSSSDKRHKSHKKYKSSKRGKNKKDCKKHRSSSSSSSSESFTN